MRNVSEATLHEGWFGNWVLKLQKTTSYSFISKNRLMSSDSIALRVN